MDTFSAKKAPVLYLICNEVTYDNKFILSINMSYFKISALSADISLALITIFALPASWWKKNTGKTMEIKVCSTEKVGVLRLWVGKSHKNDDHSPLQECELILTAFHSFSFSNQKEDEVSGQSCAALAAPLTYIAGQEHGKEWDLQASRVLLAWTLQMA